MGHFTAREIKLHDGRRVSITAYGAGDLARPYFYLHGFPGSRIEGELAHLPAKELGITVIALDRPGFGGTDSWPRRTLADFPPVLKEVASHLGISRFGILAVSGGAPYALATAATLHEEVAAVGIISGMGPVTSTALLDSMVLPNKVLLRAARVAPPVAFGIAWSMAQWWRTFPDHMGIWLRALLRGEDRKALSSDSVDSFIRRNLQVSLSQGAGRAAEEVLLLAKPWNFDLGRIKAPVIYWHGDADDYVPLSLARASSSQVPTSTLKIVPGRGHFMVLSMVDEILTELNAVCSVDSF